MRPMEQVMVLSTKPAHLVVGAICFVLSAAGVIMLSPDAFKIVVSLYLAWRVARWVVLAYPEQK